MWALSYSKKQKSFHIGTLEKETRMNMQMACGGIEGSYMIIFVDYDKEKVHAKADELREALLGWTK